jgi:hypothetical protein
MKKALLIAFVMLYCSAARECCAQTVGVADKPDRSYFGIGDDIRYYQIVYYRTNEDYASYSRAVREKIKQSFSSAYKRFYKGGDVSLLFIVNSDGTLAQYDVDPQESTGDRKLIAIAVTSLKKSSPFPPFPERLAESQLPFSIMISFREEE